MLFVAVAGVVAVLAMGILLGDLKGWSVVAFSIIAVLIVAGMSIYCLKREFDRQERRND